MLFVSEKIQLSDDEYSFTAIRAQGAGGQNVNKVSTAVQMRFDIVQSSLPEEVKTRLLALADQRITKQGVLVMKVQEARTRERNLQMAMERLKEFILQGTRVRKRRLATRPSFGAKVKRLDKKTIHGRKKTSRGRVTDLH